jgi:hypothetical protein
MIADLSSVLVCQHPLRSSPDLCDSAVKNRKKYDRRDAELRREETKTLPGFGTHIAEKSVTSF